MDYNYHTHTPRCHHAIGEPEEYVLRAIDGGIKYMGFSEHAPFICANGEESSYRLPMKEVKDYYNEIKALAKKYKDKIDIKVGFEMEYYPEDFENMLRTAVDAGIEYLILGQHSLGDESLYITPSIVPTDNAELLNNYVNLVIEGIKTKKFTYVAHPDIFNFCGNVDKYCEEMRKICKTAKEYNIPLEINLSGIKGNMHYPNEIFLKLAGEEQAPITFGFDAHNPINSYDGDSLKTALEYVKEYNLNYIGKPDLIFINK